LKSYQATLLLFPQIHTGNEKLVSRVVNDLFKKGAEVIYESLADIHVSGHASQEELKLIHRLIRPKYFMPVHVSTAFEAPCKSCR